MQYKIGTTGPWTGLLTTTTTRFDGFVGTPGIEYYFQIRATDNVSNTLLILDFGLPILDWKVTIQNPARGTPAKSKI